VTSTPEQVKRRRGERGNVMIMTAILAVGLVLAVGLCIDGARIYMTRAELQNAADAAALAAARELNGGTGGLTDAVAAAQSSTLETNKYGLNRTGGNAPAVTISTVEFAPTLGGPWDTVANIDETEAKTINYVRVTTLISVTPVLFGVKALGNNHSESRTATAGYSAPINTICDFFPIAVALDPANNPADGDDPSCVSNCYPQANTPMSLSFVQGSGSSATLDNKNYIILEVPDITGNGSPETAVLSAGLTSICQTLNAAVPFHMTPSANQNNGPRQITDGVNTRFNVYANGYSNALVPSTYPPDSNVRESITFQQYDNRTAVTQPNPNAPGEDMRRVLIVPIVWPGTYDSSNCTPPASCPNAPIRKWAAFFLKDKSVVTNPCSKSTAQCGELHVEWIDEKIMIGRGGFDPAGGCSNLSVAVLYQ
jgi:putative Flp pilus-assembly TadE/G-like protein